MKPLSHFEQTRIIRKEILQSYNDLRSKYPILQQQNLLGMLIFMLSITMLVTSSILWYKEIMPTWLLIIFNAFWLGVLHEMEHDLIHWMYFKSNKVIHNFLLFAIWIIRPLTINPWVRRTLHFHHHKYSGAKHDVEERAVTNGEKWSLKRFFATPDIFMGGLMRLQKMFNDLNKSAEEGLIKEQVATKLKRLMVNGMLPITVIAHIILYVFTIQLGLDVVNHQFYTTYHLPSWIEQIMTAIYPIVAIILLPNLLRQFSLHFITSNLHYYGDIDSNNVLQQTQVLNVWWTYPMQLFCFFFGWTHAIHHFVVNETFYIRHFTRKKAHKIMKEYGVRFNDLGTFKRANRYKEITQ